MRVVLIIFLILLGSNFYGQNKKADSLKKLLNQYQQDDTRKVDLLNDIGLEYWITDTGESLKYGNEALLLAQKIKYLLGSAKANRVIGVAYWAQGNQNKALQYLTDSQKAFQDINNEEGIANTMLNIGMVYADLKQYEKAIQNYNLAIDNFTALDLTSRIATTFTKIGTIYIERGLYDDARKYISDALKLHNQNNFKYGVAEAHNRLGILYLNEKKLAQAKYHLERSISIGKQIDDKDGITSNLIQYGKLLRIEKNYDPADIHLQLGLERAKRSSLKKYELLAYEELKELNKLQNKSDEALKYYDSYVQLKDSIFNIEKSKQIAYLEFENELEQKNKELEFLQEKEKVDNLIKSSLILGIIVISISGYIILRNNKQRSKKNKELLEKRNELLKSKEILSKQAIENARLKQHELKQQLEFKNKELTSYTINFVQKNELLEQLQDTVALAKKATSKEKDRLIDELNKTIRQNLNIDKSWEDFKRFFEEVHVGFYSKLKSRHPDLSTNDIKICSLTRLNLNIKETASILRISPESVKTARYRLRKKLELKPNQEIFTYLLGLERK